MKRRIEITIALLIVSFLVIFCLNGCDKQIDKTKIENQEMDEKINDIENDVTNVKNEDIYINDNVVGDERKTETIVFRLHADKDPCVYYSSEVFTPIEETIVIKYSGNIEMMSFWIKPTNAVIDPETAIFELRNEKEEALSVVPGMDYQLVVNVPFERVEQEDLAVELSDVTIRSTEHAPIPTFFDDNENAINSATDINSLSGGYPASKATLEDLSLVSNHEDEPIGIKIESALIYLSTRLEMLNEEILEVELNKSLEDIKAQLEDIEMLVNPEVYQSLFIQYEKQKDNIGKYIAADEIRMTKDENGQIVSASINIEFEKKNMKIECVIEEDGLISNIIFLETE